MWKTPIPGFVYIIVLLGAVLLALAYSFRDRTRRRRDYDGENDDPAWIELGSTSEIGEDGPD